MSDRGYPLMLERVGSDRERPEKFWIFYLMSDDSCLDDSVSSTALRKYFLAVSWSWLADSRFPTMHHVSGQSLAFDRNCDESAKGGFVTFSFVSRVTNLIKQSYLSYRIDRLNSILIQIIYMVLLFESFDKFQSPEDISADRIDIWPAGLKPIQFHDDFAARYPNWIIRLKFRGWNSGEILPPFGLVKSMLTSSPITSCHLSINVQKLF